MFGYYYSDETLLSCLIYMYYFKHSLSFTWIQVTKPSKKTKDAESSSGISESEEEDEEDDDEAEQDTKKTEKTAVTKVEQTKGELLIHKSSLDSHLLNRKQYCMI